MGGTAGNREIHFRKSTNGGTTWQAAKSKSANGLGLDEIAQDLVQQQDFLGRHGDIPPPPFQKSVFYKKVGHIR